MVVKNYAIIDWKRKYVYLSFESENEENGLLFHGEEHAFHQCIIIIVKATKYLEKECQGFLLNVGESSMKQQDIDPSGVRVVKEYLYVFRE